MNGPAAPKLGYNTGSLSQRMMLIAAGWITILLLVGGLLIGWLAGPDGLKPLDKLFFDLFKGMLAIFLLFIGVVFWAFRPGSRPIHQDAANSIFRHDKKPAAAEGMRDQRAPSLRQPEEA